jgi:prepilin-type processing-associated H-X9-DG protein
MKSGVNVLHADGTVQRMPYGEVGQRVESKMRRFYLNRLEDVSGTSGVGFIAEGVVFEDGTTALRWRTEYTSTAIYSCVSDMIMIHGHDGRTNITWVDDG